MLEAWKPNVNLLKAVDPEVVTARVCQIVH